MRLIVVNAVETDSRNMEAFDLIKSTFENLEIIKCSFETINDHLSLTIPTFYAVFAINNVDIQKSVALFEHLKTTIHKNLYRGLLIAALKNHKVHDLFKKIGCSEIIEPNIKAKSFFYKINLGFRSLKSQFEQAQKELQFGQKRQDDTNVKEKTTDNTRLKFEVKKSDPLPIDCDFWLRKEDKDTKMLMGKWYLRLMGPSPIAGFWENAKVELDGKHIDGWVWKFKTPEHQKSFNYEKGSWYYFGQKPDYDWRADRWTFISKFIEMFYKDGTIIHKKIVVHEELLTIAENSHRWAEKENIIRETFDQEIAIKNQKQIQVDTNIDAEISNDRIFTESLDPEQEAIDLEIRSREEESDQNEHGSNQPHAVGKLLRLDKNSPADKIDQHMQNEENVTEKILNEAWSLEANQKVFKEFSITIRMTGVMQHFGVCHFYDKINDYLYLKGKKKDFSMGNNPIKLEIQLNYGEFMGSLSIVGTIETITEESEEMIFKIKILKDAENNMDKVLKVITERQKNIGTFFNLARGF